MGCYKESESKKKVVVDTNIFVSGIHWIGLPYKIIILGLSNSFDLITSKEILDEIIGVLIDFKKYLNIHELKWWKKTIIKNSSVLKPRIRLNIVKEDSEDNKFIEVAEYSKADYIVTRDKHLLKIKEHKKTKIVSPEEFWELIN